MGWAGIDPGKVPIPGELTFWGYSRSLGAGVRAGSLLFLRVNDFGSADPAVEFEGSEIVVVERDR